VLESTENSMRIKILDADASVMYPVVENLLSDERVTEANFSVEHQELDDPVLFIKCKGDSDPRDVLTETATDLQGQFSKVYAALFEDEE